MDALRHDNPEPAHVRADRVCDPRPLPEHEAPGHKRMVCRVTASQMASASAVSVLLRFT